jgi:hypothetical protein
VGEQVTFPTPHTVTLLEPTLSEDEDGNTVEQFSPGTELPAYAIAPHINETRSDATMLDTWDVDVFMPKATIEVQDRLVFDGVTYDVVDVADWTNGFQGWKPGIVVGLRKWEG